MSDTPGEIASVVIAIAKPYSFLYNSTGQKAMELTQMELRQLKYLVAIVDFGSFSRASAQINIAQPALSAQIANLEAELSTSLLVRSSLGVAPTEAGLRLYRQAQSILNQVEQAKSDAKLTGSLDQITGTVSVGFPGSAANIIALPLIEKMRQRYPGIYLRIVETLSGHLLEMLMKNRIDLAIQFTTARMTGLHLEPLVEEDLFLVSNIRETEGKPIRLNDVGDSAVAIPGKPHALRILLDEYCDMLGVSLNVIADVDSLPALRGLAASGLAQVILPYSALVNVGYDNLLFSRPIVEPKCSRPVSMCRSEGAPRSRAIQATEEAMRFLIKDLFNDGVWKGMRLAEELAGRAPDPGFALRKPRRFSTDLA
jgi:LysR family transcriptional regulator, nitrogen assimilation regulatory protein